MKNLFEAATVEEVKGRIARLKPASERVWGKMSAAQALAHCSAAMEMAVGEKFPPRMFIGLLLGRFAKKSVITNEKPMFRNSGTHKSLLVNDQRDFDVERHRLREFIDRFASGGPAACTKHPHFFFGPLTPVEWAALICRGLSFRPQLLPIYRQLDLFHFLNLRDHNRVRPFALKYGSASSHVFADELHQFLPLIRVGHFVGDGEIQVTILGQNDEWRTTLHAFPYAFEAKVSRT
jgi:hypothetical protein